MSPFESIQAKPAILVAPPADERDAWRLIVDAIATEIVPPSELADALRPVLAKLARGVDFDDPAYAAELLDAARTLERADARRTWARLRGSWRERYMSSAPHYRAVVLASMRDAWRQFHGA